jgi:DNA-binding transcriptional ArsR family regulator
MKTMTPEKDTTIYIKRLSSDTEYFTNVFKKTEKVVSVIFYILSHINQTKDSETHVSVIKDRALKTHEVSLQTLQLQPHEVSEGLLSFQYTLVGLESTIRIAEAASVIPQNIANLLFEQLITIERYLSNHYIKDQGIDLSEQAALTDAKGGKMLRPKSTTVTSTVPRRRAVSIPQNDISSDAYLVYSHLTDRAERIKTVLEAKPQATIKDISEIITDVSEKTIQRELNSLIEKGQVLREGERRWSRYSVVK